MKRGSFIKRLLGLAATAAVAPQVLAEEKPIVGLWEQMHPEKFHGRKMIQVTGRQTYRNIPVVPYNIAVDSQGRHWFVRYATKDTATMVCSDDHTLPEITVPNPLPHDQYMVICSAMSEGSQI